MIRSIMTVFVGLLAAALLSGCCHQKTERTVTVHERTQRVVGRETVVTPLPENTTESGKSTETETQTQSRVVERQTVP